MIIGIDEVEESRLRILQTSSPSTSGSMRSRTIRSGRSSLARAIARVPSLAKIGVYPASRSLNPSTSSASGSSSTTSIFVFMDLLAGMPDIDRLVQIDNLLGDVCRVIGDPFEALGYDHEVKAAGDCRGPPHHEARELAVQLAVDVVHLQVARNDAPRPVRFAVDERRDRIAEHLECHRGH